MWKDRSECVGAGRFADSSGRKAREDRKGRKGSSQAFAAFTCDFAVELCLLQIELRQLHGAARIRTTTHIDNALGAEVHAGGLP